MNYEKNVWKTGDLITEQALNHMEGGIARNSTSFEAILNQLENSDTQNEAQIKSVQSRIDELWEALLALKHEDTIVTDVVDNQFFHDPTQDVTITSSATVTEKVSVVCKNAKVDNLQVDSNVLDVEASGDLVIKNFTNSGALPKSKGNASLILDSNDTLLITNCTFGQQGYNSIEIGLDASVSAPRSITISNCTFDATLDNNAINIFAHQEGAVITISNCHFKKVSNVLRLSNRLNTNATINIVNCTCDEWGTQDPYFGFLLMQDYTSQSLEQVKKENRFAKLKINFINLVGPNGKVLPETLESVCPGGSEPQLMYMYNKFEQVVSFDATRYPQVTFA